MNNRKLMIVAICAALTTSTGVFAQGFGPESAPSMDQAAQRALLDTDGDGVVSREEHEAARQLAFDDADTDGDGYLDYAEMEAMAEASRNERLNAHFDLMDADGDGSVTADEFLSSTPEGAANLVTALFDAFSGGDGVLSDAEFAELNGPEGDRIKRYLQLDKDGDGVISSEEFGTPVRRGPPAGANGGATGNAGNGGPGSDTGTAPDGATGTKPDGAGGPQGNRR